MRFSRLFKVGVTFLIAILVVAGLVYLTLMDPVSSEQVHQAAVFLILVIITTMLGVPLGGGTVSLLPMAVAATYLALGLVSAGWVAVLGEIVSEILEGVIKHNETPDRPKSRLDQITRLAANISLQPLSILIAGTFYQASGGSQPLRTITIDLIVPFIILGLTYLMVNYIGAGLFFAGRGRSWLKSFLNNLPTMLIYEGSPLVFAPWVALVFIRMGPNAFIVLVLGLGWVAWLARNLSFARQRLERRVRELDVLQKVSHALSVNLDLDTLLEAFYTQITGLMPADYFYISLYDPALDEVSFPFVIEGGKRTSFPNRRAGAGLTEYILRTGQPVLSRTTTSETRKQLGLSPATRPAASWLGVPVIVGSQIIGVIAVQSYEARHLYDENHQKVLTALAAEAGIAIQNARLFSQTDQDLNLRLRQLDSVLKAAQDGMLLLDCQGKVLMANRSATEYLGLTQLDLKSVISAASESQAELLSDRLGFSTGELDSVMASLLESQNEFHRQTLNLPDSPILAVERTLLPVRNQRGEVSGWLIVLHDRTQEVELAAYQEDMIEMIVHDLRSPLTIIQGGLEVIAKDVPETPESRSLIVLSSMRRSTQRMLRLVNDILEINRLEKGELVLQPRRVPVRNFLDESAAAYTPILQEAGIELTVNASPDLPDLSMDPAHSERLLHNLLDNAIKFTPDNGKISLSACRDGERDSSAVIIKLQDSGSGIPAVEQARLFEKYRTLDGKHGRRRGSGLGLYYCRLIAEAHGGKIWVESPPDQGACFNILLPTIDSAVCEPIKTGK